MRITHNPKVHYKYMTYTLYIHKPVLKHYTKGSLATVQNQLSLFYVINGTVIILKYLLSKMNLLKVEHIIQS